MSFSNSQAQVNLADVRVYCHATVCLPSSMCSSRFGWLLRAWPRCVDQHLRCSDWPNESDSCKNPKWLPLIAALTRRRDRAQSSSGEFTMHGTCWFHKLIFPSVLIGIRWDNSGSRFTSKTIKYRVWSTPYVPETFDDANPGELLAAPSIGLVRSASQQAADEKVCAALVHAALSFSVGIMMCLMYDALFVDRALRWLHPAHPSTPAQPLWHGNHRCLACSVDPYRCTRQRSDRCVGVVRANPYHYIVDISAVVNASGS